MARPVRDLTAAQVAEIKGLGHSDTCTEPGCGLPIIRDGAWAEGEAQDTCSLHRQRARNAAGVCPNCAGTMATVPIINDLTGKPRTSNGVPQTHRACTSCGYVQKQQRPRQGRR
jgi:hypothetical protein